VTAVDLSSSPAWHDPAPPAGSDGAAGGVRAGLRSGLTSGLRSLVSASTITGGLTELAWVGAHTLLYPLGTRTERLRPDPRLRPDDQPGVRALFAADPLAAQIPVVLVHGLVDNRSVFAVMGRSLRRRGFAHVRSWNYSPLLRDVETAAAALGAQIERICAETGHERVHVVGHSLGGLVARYLVQRLGGDRRVETLVTLGTPHTGTRWAHLLPTPLVRQLRPGSPLLAELAAPATGCRTRVTAVYSDLDQMVVPATAGRCDHPDLGARNVLVRGVGHMSLPIHRTVVDEVAATLAGHRQNPGNAATTAVA
jgi:triacylglycerol lipase